MAQLTLEGINKVYPDGAHIIKNANLHIEDGEFTVFVGPSGCGKSTMLRMVAGLEEISSGDMKLDGEVVNNLSPNERGIGMVFQSYALYPHMTIYENIEFGLKLAKKLSKEEIEQAVNRVAEMLELTHLLGQKPSQLSGGQRQRVAIGRAIVRNPTLFLLDEPLSNLDAALRVRMRLQLADYHKELKSTVIYVTHDQVEAMTLADKIVVLRDGIVEQVGSPLELYHFPQTLFVAGFIGSPKMNQLAGTVINADAQHAAVEIEGCEAHAQVDASLLNQGESVTLGIRPEDVELANDGLPVRVISVEQLGTESLLYTQIVDSDQELLVRVPGTMAAERHAVLRVQLPSDKCHLFDSNEKALKRNIKMEDLVELPPQLTTETN
ncbi:ABC transporter ATP-binding protein [Vibrio maerlii]|uniref:ABC transporter ATP-binding protein n=1 Tax=Vibrio maerlii TaxID=2231648 RepID=UPI000E3DD97B|nr:sn-glycerol-3-phosphate ABC transporter ATP-binding protein UgpC [Vibrio maerlii]